MSFGIHRKFFQKFRLVTIIRDAFGRVRSNYTYDSMRRQEPVSNEIFCSYFRQEVNINRSTKQLAGQIGFQNPATPGLLERAILNLEHKFDAFVTHNEIKDLVSNCLSLYKLPNVVMDRINVTLPKYAIDASKYESEILQLNNLDDCLYNYVKRRFRLPKIAIRGDRVHDQTIIINNIDSEAYALAESICVPTEVVLNEAVTRYF